MDNTMKEELMNKALLAREKSYCKYSGYMVGAALLSKDGKIFTGCNIENASYTPTNCAERTAFFKAVSEGVTEFEAIAVAGGHKGDKLSPTTPCGVCLQVMLEFCKKDEFDIITFSEDGEIVSRKLAQYLPYGFEL